MAVIGFGALVALVVGIIAFSGLFSLMNKESMMDKYDVTLYGVDSYTGYPTALTYRLEASSVGIAVDLARLAVNGNYPEFVEDYELYKERMGAK
jgi:hypothetical protein